MTTTTDSQLSDVEVATVAMILEDGHMLDGARRCCFDFFRGFFPLDENPLVVCPIHLLQVSH